MTMTVEQAVLSLRQDPAHADLIRDAYLGPDALANAERFRRSGEFGAVLRLLGHRVQGARILDLGAGTGIASFAFARSGAREVVALEPDPSDVVGQGAILRVAAGLPISIADGWGEALPFEDARFDIVYARQVLHHARDLDALVAECVRVTATGGVVLATREHVVDDEVQLAAFLASHPVHRLAGGEHAFALEAYVASFRRAGLGSVRVLGPWDSVINAFPAFEDDDALRAYPRKALEERFGRVGRAAAHVPGIVALVRRRFDRPVPGRLFTFLGHKP